MRNLIYINNGVSSVFESQVLAFVKYVKQCELFDRVTLLFGYKNNGEKEFLKTRCLEGIDVIYFKTFPNYCLFNWLIKINLQKAIATLGNDHIAHSIFHIRGEMMSYHLWKIKSRFGIYDRNIVTDIRGVSLEEYKIYSSKSPYDFFKISNYRNALKELKNNYGKISVVSNALKTFLVDKYKVDQSRIAVNSCLVGPNFNFSIEKRVEIRRQMNLLEEEILIVFASGGTAAWQLNERITELANNGFKVLNLSRKAINHGNIINKFISFNKMPEYLSAADVAFIWRDHNIVNWVSSPVKFSEYLACGLPLIHNGSIDLVSRITMEFDCGLQVSDISSISRSKVRDLIDKTDRVKLGKKGQTIFGMKRAVHGYSELYALSNNLE